MKTVIKGGKVYEIGKIYCDNSGIICQLIGYKNENFIVGHCDSEWASKVIYTVPAESLGEITAKPVKLINGCIYRYNVTTADGVVTDMSNLGFYDESRYQIFYGNVRRDIKYCSDIVKLSEDE